MIKLAKTFMMGWVALFAVNSLAQNEESVSPAALDMASLLDYDTCPPDDDCRPDEIEDNDKANVSIDHRRGRYGRGRYGHGHRYGRGYGYGRGHGYGHGHGYGRGRYGYGRGRYGYGHGRGRYGYGHGYGHGRGYYGDF